MKLISCEHCGVVLDQDKLSFPNNIWTENDDSIDTNKADYNQRTKTWVVFINCPVCKEKIFHE